MAVSSGSVASMRRSGLFVNANNLSCRTAGLQARILFVDAMTRADLEVRGPARLRGGARLDFGQRHHPVAEGLDLAAPDRFGRIDQVVGELGRHLELEGHDQPA